MGEEDDGSAGGACSDGNPPSDSAAAKVCSKKTAVDPRVPMHIWLKPLAWAASKRAKCWFREPLGVRGRLTPQKKRI